MPAFKYKTKSGDKWLAKFYYEGHGVRKQKLKRGFSLKRDAEAFEREFLFHYQDENVFLSLPWNDFVDRYQAETSSTIGEHTRKTRYYQIKNHIRPAFVHPINEITVVMLQEWTNSLTDKYSLTHARNIYTLMRAVFNYAERVYNLNPNPVKRLKPPVKREMKNEMQFWIHEEFKAVMSAMEDIKAKTAVILLYYSGIRKGELFALLWTDIQGNYLNIDKSLQRLHGKNVITPPKSYDSVRKILLPSQALKALNEWNMIQKTDEIFPWEKTFIEKGIKQACKDSGIKRIRVHDLRHSHASYLISKGANIKLISKRLGHAKTSITLDTYGHMFPSDEHTLIELIEMDE